MLDVAAATDLVGKSEVFELTTNLPDDVDEFMNIANEIPGDCKLMFHLPNSGSPRPLKVLAHNIKVSTASQFIKNLRNKYGKDSVWIE